MTRILHIKNMVCDRCKTAVKQVLKNEGIDVASIELGQVTIHEKEEYDYLKLERILDEHGFELIKESSAAIIEKIKVTLIQHLDEGNTDHILTDLAKALGKTYSALSKSFSKQEGVTLEKYMINLKIEKVKEHIQLQQLNFSEIAYSLNYKNSSHLAKQFKNVTGMSMTDYKQLQDWDRKSLDQIV